MGDACGNRATTAAVGAPLSWLAIGIAVLIGFVGGSIWIAWKLLELHVLR